MTRLFTRMGDISDTNRLAIRGPRLNGSYGGTIRREGFAAGVYGKDLEEALQNSLRHISLEKFRNVNLRTSRG